ncbi:MAG TPA: hypothetical protein VK766_03805 [Cytophagaceae bacterium]|jgi:hypothetical protein|nr:hypothetical protein [Cytophagaceae bacterium]
MRTVAEIPHSDFKITVFAWNNKYIIKLEKGNYEQTYKVSEMDTNGDEDVYKLIKDEAFINAAKDRFKEMNQQLNEALNRL